MKRAHSRNGEFRKVAEHLYRYSANKIYYAVFKVRGKRIWNSLETTDRELANRKLKEELGKRGKLDHRVGRMTLAELLLEYEELIKGLATTRGQRENPSSLSSKEPGNTISRSRSETSPKRSSNFG